MDNSRSFPGTSALMLVLVAPYACISDPAGDGGSTSEAHGSSDTGDDSAESWEGDDDADQEPGTGSVGHTTSATSAAESTGGSPPDDDTTGDPTADPTGDADDDGTSTGAAPPLEFECTLVIGFSQTESWFDDVEALVDETKWQRLTTGGAGINTWSDPDHGNWNTPIGSDCAAGRASVDRVILTVSIGAYEDDVDVWVSHVTDAVDNIRDRYPASQQIALQAVVGPPVGGVCPPGATGQAQVRASFNHPYIVEALAAVADADPDDEVVVGMEPRVSSCDDYSDGTGHLTNSGQQAVAGPIAAFYDG